MSLCQHLVSLMFLFVPQCPCRKLLQGALHHKQQGPSIPLKFPSQHTGAHTYAPLLPCSEDHEMKQTKNDLNSNLSALAWNCHKTGLRARSHQMLFPLPHTVPFPQQGIQPMWDTTD